ncbi:hypothetical protein E2C01_079022 [Portunus trituberculatus]|uniref:Uncharacterized protein n=1 Tax=Portunus trituberculatus TaxID=210409 RepID=A0A5B7IRN7_PORTR|nr:hypothetical protein [Portunus trituberculatus]
MTLIYKANISAFAVLQYSQCTVYLSCATCRPLSWLVTSLLRDARAWEFCVTRPNFPWPCTGQPDRVVNAVNTPITVTTRSHSHRAPLSGGAATLLSAC